MINKSIIITAGGIGSRMGADIPKQFLLLAGRPILMHTIEKFHQFDPEIQLILVLPEGQIESWNALCVEYNFKIDLSIVKGGKERFDSVKNGLAQARGEIIGVHDAVRPLVALEVIANCYQMAKDRGTAVPVIPINESIRKMEVNFSKAVNRADYKLVQTPQCFQSTLIKKAYSTNHNYETNFTDDASVLEASGEMIDTVIGNRENIKITNPIDLKIAEILIKSE